MAVLELQTRSFRNLEDCAVDTGSSSVFLIGENGQGKTNFLDAVYTLCYAGSFRGSTDPEAARLGSQTWLVKGSCGPMDQGETGDLPDEYSVSWERGVKSLRQNGKPIHDRKRLVERNPAVVFCHEDMEFSRGEPERRRFFFDQTAGLVSLGYIDLLRLYRRTLKARNAALKERSIDILPLLDIQLAGYGLGLRDERVRLSMAFDAVFAPVYERVSLLGSRVGLEYRPSWKAEDSEGDILARLELSRDRELAIGTSLSGPHRDRYVFLDEHGDFSERASTGQLRLLALTLRIAQATHYTAMTGRKPILLLDDVLLELDPEKRRRFMDNLPGREQAFFTFLPGEPYSDYAESDTRIYRTKHGRFTDTQGR